jgi:hypothetical protein
MDLIDLIDLIDHIDVMDASGVVRRAGLPGMVGPEGDGRSVGCPTGERRAVKLACRVMWEGWRAQSCRLEVIRPWFLWVCHRLAMPDFRDDRSLPSKRSSLVRTASRADAARKWVGTCINIRLQGEVSASR